MRNTSPFIGSVQIFNMMRKGAVFNAFGYFH